MAPVDRKRLPFWYEGERPPAELRDIERAEKYVGRQLPRELRSLLLEQNGGVSNYSAYRKGRRYYPLLPMFSVDPEAAADSIMRAFDVRAAFGVPDGVVAFAGQGHSWWGIDYRGSDKVPGIVFRQDEEHEPEAVTSSFAELLESLIAE